MAPPFRVFEGKLAIITGASRSFGAACAEHFASRGANVVINYATEGSTAKAQALAKDFESKYHVKALTVQADLSSVEGPQQVVDAAKGHFADAASGRFQIDIIVNNAATVNGQRLDELDLDLFQKTFDTNCRAPALLIKAAFPYLPTDRSGRIVNISSATTTWGVFGQTSYAGTKGALEAMTRVWARELAEKATVNCVSPAPWTPNALTPLAAVRPGVDSQSVLDLAKSIGGRPGYLEEIAGIVGICCLPESGWMTGNQVGASGGGHFVR
ncbi:3-oxoacyl-reductase [Apiospora phragmitis]|uniref:3-oxoacyl-reductase n=1 Tax=Apiospora phragmitis TaxID=2905665 RepID=A0ABR1VDW2_9PEZI